VEISVPIERAPELRPGMSVELLNGKASVGTSRVFFIAPNTATNTQSVLIKSLFDNSRGQLRADQYVRARVIWNQSLSFNPNYSSESLGGKLLSMWLNNKPNKNKPKRTIPTIDPN